MVLSLCTSTVKSPKKTEDAFKVKTKVYYNSSAVYFCFILQLFLSKF